MFSPTFPRAALAANYLGMASFVANAWLLLTYVVLPEEKSHRHYLSIGLTTSFIVASLAFVVPIGTRPNLCYDAITPRNMLSSMSCAWTGALLLSGFMGVVVWSKSFQGCSG